VHTAGSASDDHRDQNHAIVNIVASPGDTGCDATDVAGHVRTPTRASNSNTAIPLQTSLSAAFTIDSSSRPISTWERSDTTFVEDAQRLKANAAARSGTARSYVVRCVDTLEGMAAAQYGDAQLWWVIAQANTQQGRGAPVEGSTLQLPEESAEVPTGLTRMRRPTPPKPTAAPQAVPPLPPSQGLSV
jgi:hypothetical protein